MRLLIPLSAVVVTVLLAGCASQEPKFTEVPGISNSSPNAKAAPTKAAVVKPDDSLTGRVVSANARGRFAILNFPINRMPAVDTKMFIYRDGLKIGEARISGPQKDDNIVADVLTGEARGGDEVRDR
jgi:hypothetical protein